MIQQQNEELPQQSQNFLLGNDANVTVVKLTHVVCQPAKVQLKELKETKIGQNGGSCGYFDPYWVIFMMIQVFVMLGPE